MKQTRKSYWIRTSDLELASKICTGRNKSHRYEIFGEYGSLSGQVLRKGRARAWLYYREGRLAGVALGARREYGWRPRGTFVFVELWGMPDSLFDNADGGEVSVFRQLLMGESFERPVVLRAPVDNSFAHRIAEGMRARWINCFLLAERPTQGDFRIRIPNGYKIRRFRRGDESSLSALHKKLFRESAPDFSRWAIAPHCRAFVSTKNGLPVGLFIAERRPYDRLGDFYLTVDPSHHGKGVGSALLCRGFRAFQEMGVRRVIADYLLLNAPAHSLYQKYGFKIVRAYNYFLLAGGDGVEPT